MGKRIGALRRCEGTTEPPSGTPTASVGFHRGWFPGSGAAFRPDRDAFPGLPDPVAPAAIFSSTVAGAAPDLDRLPNSPGRLGSGPAPRMRIRIHRVGAPTRGDATDDGVFRTLLSRPLGGQVGKRTSNVHHPPHGYQKIHISQGFRIKPLILPRLRGRWRCEASTEGGEWHRPDSKIASLRRSTPPEPALPAPAHTSYVCDLPEVEEGWSRTVLKAQDGRILRFTVGDGRAPDPCSCSKRGAINPSSAHRHSDIR